MSIVKGPEELAWINNLEGFDRVVDSGNSKTIWKWLASREVSLYIQLVDDAFYNLREADINREGIIER